MTAHVSRADLTQHWPPVPAAGRRPDIAPSAQGMNRACAVHLIDRRTGAAHRINGTPLVIFTHDPQAAAAELLEGRDPANWEARVESFVTARRPDQGSARK